MERFILDCPSYEEQVLGEVTYDPDNDSDLDSLSPSGCPSNLVAFDEMMTRVPNRVMWKGHSAQPPMVLSSASLSGIVIDSASVLCGSAQPVVNVVEWPDLEAVVRSAARMLTPDKRLRPVLHSVVWCRPNDFVDYCVDKQDAGHVLTLAVDAAGTDDCVGGEIVFRDAEMDELHRATTGVWSGNGKPGSWCCWYASHGHVMAEVTSGCRVIVTYKLFVTGRDTTWLTHQSQSQLSLLGRDLGGLLISKLEKEDLTRLARTCRDLYRICGTPVASLSSVLLELRRDPVFAKQKSFGFVLRHVYSADNFAAENLRGSDAFLGAALVRAFGNIRLKHVPCFICQETVVEECDDGDYNFLFANEGAAAGGDGGDAATGGDGADGGDDNDSFGDNENEDVIMRYRICVAIQKAIAGKAEDGLFRVPDNLIQFTGGCSVMSESARLYLQRTCYSKPQWLDYDYWPFLDTVWFSRGSYLNEVTKFKGWKVAESVYSRGTAENSICTFDGSALIVDWCEMSLEGQQLQKGVAFDELRWMPDIFL